MARRNRGLGAVFLRADGRWEGQIRIGGGRRRSFYARTRRDLVHKLAADARWALGEGLPVNAGTQSLRAYLEYWLMIRGIRLRPITMVAYARDVSRLTAVLGDVPLRSLTPGLVQSAYAALDQGFSKRTVEKTHAVLHRAMDQAMHWGPTLRNPTELVSPPRPARREMTALTGAQFRQLLRKTEGSRWHPLWVMLRTSGLRVGEALGLGWQDVDLEGARLAVRHSLQRVPGKGFVLAQPKTQKSRRTIYLSVLACGALEQQRTRQCSDRQKATGGPRPAWSSRTATVRR
jgi:integrase